MNILKEQTHEKNFMFSGKYLLLWERPSRDIRLQPGKQIYALKYANEHCDGIFSSESNITFGKPCHVPYIFFIKITLGMK